MSNYSQLQQAAARELYIRRKARADILQYVTAIDVPGRPISDDPETELFQPIETTIAAHHRLLLQKLDEISSTPHGRLMVFMPPGSAKSTYASVVFPSRYLGKTANRKIILASYGDDLARKLGRRTRSIIKQARYQGIFSAGLTAESQAAQEFSLTNGSEYMACGILSGVTGNRAHGVIIDDPIKGREQANSETIREKTFDAFEDDLKTRLIPGGWIVLIQTRWHQDDLAGRILPDDWAGQSGKIRCKDGNDWEVLCLQARCESENDPLGRKPGEYLWPEWFDLKHWAQFEQNQRTWSALYQQRPSPLEGDLFKPDKIEIIDALPSATNRFVRAWDLASTVNGGDWTAGIKLAKLPDGRWLIADVARLQGGPETVEAAIVNGAKRDGSKCKIRLPQDPGQAGKSQVAYLTKQLSGFTVISHPVTGDKVTRAEPMAAQVNVGNVLMLRAPWNDTLIAEMRMFPNGSHDDQIDALSDAFSELTQGYSPDAIVTPLRM